jgi:hypothetical protein
MMAKTGLVSLSRHDPWTEITPLLLGVVKVVVGMAEVQVIPVGR